MSMPQPIHVVLIGSSKIEIAQLRKGFRLSAPGIGPAYFAALDASPGEEIVRPKDLPYAEIDLWIALDAPSLLIARDLHDRDRHSRRYDRGYYAHVFPEPCVLLNEGQPSLAVRKKRLMVWSGRITTAWHESS